MCVILLYPLGNHGGFAEASRGTEEREPALLYGV